MVAAARKGDDALLRMLVGLFEDAGFRAVSVAEAAPGLVADEGPLGGILPDDDHKADIARAFAIVRALGALDVGQAAAVCEGLALAVEAAEGTDAMIARIGQLRENLRGTPQKRRGVLVKALKPTQDAKTDMPVIGVETVRRAAEVGLAGIAVEAGKSLIVDKRGGGGGGRPAGPVRGGRHAVSRATARAAHQTDKTLMLVCGEPSGDQLGAQLMAGLKQLAGDQVRIVGVGGPAMAREGLESLFPLDATAVMGLREVVPAIPENSGAREAGGGLRDRTRTRTRWW